MLLLVQPCSIALSYNVNWHHNQDKKNHKQQTNYKRQLFYLWCCKLHFINNLIERVLTQLDLFLRKQDLNNECPSSNVLCPLYNVPYLRWFSNISAFVFYAKGLMNNTFNARSGKTSPRCSFLDKVYLRRQFIWRDIVNAREAKLLIHAVQRVHGT